MPNSQDPGARFRLYQAELGDADYVLYDYEAEFPSAQRRHKQLSGVCWCQPARTTAPHF